jgi:hypothetical protein
MIDPTIVNKRNVLPWDAMSQWEPDIKKYPKCDTVVQTAVQAYDDKLRISWMPASIKNVAMFGEPEDGHLFAGDGNEMWKFKPTRNFPFQITNKTVHGGAWGLFRGMLTDHGKKFVYVGWEPIPDSHCHAELIVAHLKYADLQNKSIGKAWAQQRHDAQWNMRTKNAEALKQETKAEVHDDRKAIMRELAPAFGEKPHRQVGHGSHTSALVNQHGLALTTDSEE